MLDVMRDKFGLSPCGRNGGETGEANRVVRAIPIVPVRIEDDQLIGHHNGLFLRRNFGKVSGKGALNVPEPIFKDDQYCSLFKNVDSLRFIEDFLM